PGRRTRGPAPHRTGSPVYSKRPAGKTALLPADRRISYMWSYLFFRQVSSLIRSGRRVFDKPSIASTKPQQTTTRGFRAFVEAIMRSCRYIAVHRNTGKRWTGEGNFARIYYWNYEAFTAYHYHHRCFSGVPCCVAGRCTGTVHPPYNEAACGTNRHP